VFVIKVEVISGKLKYSSLYTYYGTKLNLTIITNTLAYCGTELIMTVKCFMNKPLVCEDLIAFLIIRLSWFLIIENNQEFLNSWLFAMRNGTF
jgi:hypothetical protein